jgi:hypothetical protein
MTALTSFRASHEGTLDLNREEDKVFLAANYPAFMSQRPAGKMSEDYQMLSSYRMGLLLQEKHGMQLVDVHQQVSRARDPRFQEHVSRFRFPDQEGQEEAVELVIMNSHNGRAAFRAFVGVFRWACFNGMIAGDAFEPVQRFRHFGADNNYELVSDLVTQMVQRAKPLVARISRMKQTTLHPAQQTALANACLKHFGAPKWVEADMVLESHRPEDDRAEDRTRSLWVTFNVIQENLMSRTLKLERPEEQVRSRRPITGARAQVVKNELLWNMLEMFIARHFPDLASERATSALIESAQQAAAQASLTAQDVLALETFAELEAVPAETIAGFSSEDRKKISSRKSYLKRKLEKA